MPYKPFNSGGYRGTGKTRIRNRLFGAILEEIQYTDGTVKWIVSSEIILSPRDDRTNLSKD